MSRASFDRLKKLIGKTKSDHFGPPKNVPPHVMWRRLLEHPGVVADLNYTIEVAPDCKLCVQTIKGSDYSKAIQRIELDGLSDNPMSIAAEVVHLTLLDKSTACQVFESAEHVNSLLTEEELVDLSLAVFPVFSEICPLFLRCDWDKWSKYLTDGLKHTTNQEDAWQLGCLREFYIGFGVARHMDRPDLYWGVPIKDLTDGNLMAFRTAADWVSEKKLQSEKKNK